MIELKSASEIALMRKAGRVVAGLLTTLAGLVQPGVKHGRWMRRRRPICVIRVLRRRS